MRCIVQTLNQLEWLGRRRLDAIREEDMDVAVAVAIKEVQLIVLLIQKTADSVVWSQAQVQKSAAAAGKWATIVAAHIARPGPAATDEQERSIPIWNLQMLEVVVVAADVKINLVLPEERAPGGLQDTVVSVRAVAE